MTPKYIIIHDTEVSHSKNPDQANATNNYHKQLWGFRSSLGYYAGYNAEISKSGKITTFRVDGEATAAAIGHNSDSLHICLDGNFDIEMPTDEQISALQTWIKAKMSIYSIPVANVRPHRYFATTSLQTGKYVPNNTPFVTWDGCMPYKFCPGKNLPDNWGQLLVAPPPSVVATEDVIQAVSILERLITLLKNYLAQRKVLGMPAYERYSD